MTARDKRDAESELLGPSSYRPLEGDPGPGKLWLALLGALMSLVTVSVTSGTVVNIWWGALVAFLLIGAWGAKQSTRGLWWEWEWKVSHGAFGVLILGATVALSLYSMLSAVGPFTGH